MNEDNNHIKALTPKIIEQYLKGELSHSDMHDVEKLMLNSDFEADAMEGFESIPSDKINNDLLTLESRLVDKINEGKRTIPVYLKIAASLLILAISTFMVIQFVQPSFDQNTLSQADEAEDAEQASAPESLESPNASTSEAEEIIDSEVQPMESAKSNNTEETSGYAEVVPEEEEPESDNDNMLAYAEEKQDEPELLDKDIIPDEESRISKAEELPAVQAPPETSNFSMARKSAKGVRSEKKRMSTKDLKKQSVEGQVVSAKDSSPLAGVNVVVKGTTTGTVTDLDGNYAVDIPAGVDSTLVFSFIGLESLAINTKGNKTLDVAMSSDVQQLSEVVVTAEEAEDAYESTFVPAQSSVGKSAFKKYLNQNIRSPKNEGKGNVVVRFTVKTDGTLSNFEISKSMGDAFDNEAIRLIKEGPKWMPAKRDDRPAEDVVKVKVRFQ